MAEKITYPFLPEDKCLTEIQLFAYIDGKLNAADMHHVEKHLLACAMCSDAIEGLEKVKSREKVAAFSPGNFSKTVDKKTDTDQKKIIPLHPNRKYYALAAGLVIIISVTLYLKLSVSNEMESAKMADLVQKDSGVSIMESPKESNGKLSDSIVSYPNSSTVTVQKEGSGSSGKVMEQLNSDFRYFDTSRNKNAENGPREDRLSQEQSKGITATGATISDANEVRFALDEKAPVGGNKNEDVVLAKAELKKTDAENNRDLKEQDSKNVSVGADDDKANKKDKMVSGRSNEKPSLHYNTTAPTVNTNVPATSPQSGGLVVSQATIADEESTISKSTDSISSENQKYYPLKPSDKDLDLSYETGVKMLDSGKVESSLVFFDQVLTNPSHKYFEDAQWKKSKALIQLNRKTEAKTLLKEIEKKGGKYAKQATEELKKL